MQEELRIISVPGKKRISNRTCGFKAALTPGFTAGRTDHFRLLKFIILLDKKSWYTFFTQASSVHFCSAGGVSSRLYMCAPFGESRNGECVEITN